MKNERGDTSVEVTIAMAILSGVIASVYLTANISFRLAVGSRQHGESTLLLQQQLELLQGIRDQDIAATPVGVVAGGWNTFRTSIFGGVTPICGVGALSSVPISLSDIKDDALNTDAWTINSGSNVVSTSNTDYTITISACYPTVLTDKIRFTAQSDWSGPGGLAQTNNAVLELVDVGDIKEKSGL